MKLQGLRDHERCQGFTMSSGYICYLLLPNKFLCVASAQSTAFSTGEDSQNAPVDTPAQAVSLEVVEQLRHDLRIR